MRLSNMTESLGRAVPLSVDFNKPEDYFIFISQILFATTTVMTAGTVVIGILSTRALRIQNRFIFTLNTILLTRLLGFQCIISVCSMSTICLETEPTLFYLPF